MLKLNDVVSSEDGVGCREKFVEEMKFQSDEKWTAAERPSTEKMLDDSAAETAGCGTSDAAAQLDVSDSELLCRKQRKVCIFDDADNIDESVISSSSASTIPPISTRQQPTGPPAVDASSFLRAVQSFPLPPEQRNRPVVGPPSLDQDTVRKMEQLEQLRVPESLPPEDVERVERLERLKQLSCSSR